MRKTIRIAVATLAVVGLMAAAPAALAKGGVSTRGVCSGPSTWKLDLRPQNGGVLRVTLEVEGGARNQTWSVSMSDNGTAFFDGNRVSGIGGAFRATGSTADQAGTDAVIATAVNQVTGEACAAAASI